MDFIDKLKIVMQSHSDDAYSLAKRAGIPYTEVRALFVRQWEKAPLWVISAICEAYSVSMDYMVRDITQREKAEP